MTRETARQFADAISRALPSQGDGVSSGSGASSGPVAFSLRRTPTIGFGFAIQEF